MSRLKHCTAGGNRKKAFQFAIAKSKNLGAEGPHGCNRSRRRRATGQGYTHRHQGLWISFSIHGPSGEGLRRRARWFWVRILARKTDGSREQIGRGARAFVTLIFPRRSFRWWFWHSRLSGSHCFFERPRNHPIPGARLLICALLQCVILSVCLRHCVCAGALSNGAGDTWTQKTWIHNLVFPWIVRIGLWAYFLGHKTWNGDKRCLHRNADG